MKFEVLRALTVKITVFWDVTPCNLDEMSKKHDASIFRLED
jgi:hypothetical protein